MIVGAVLTGGSSRRMGRTKALIEVDGVPMATRVAEALIGAGCSTVVVLGGDPGELCTLDLEVIPDEYPGQGPLGGVISALGSCAAGVTGVAVLACDLPSVTGPALAPLVAAAIANPDTDVVVAFTGRLEPACAVWNLNVLPVLREMFAAGERSIHATIERLVSLEVPFDPSVLRNINTSSDLE